jgi:hypothetical protein
MATYISFATKPNEENIFLTFRTSSELYQWVMEAVGRFTYDNLGSFQEVTKRSLEDVLGDAIAESYERERMILLGLILTKEFFDLEEMEELDKRYALNEEMKERDLLNQSIGILKLLIDTAEDNNDILYCMM